MYTMPCLFFEDELTVQCLNMFSLYKHLVSSSSGVDAGIGYILDQVFRFPLGVGGASSNSRSLKPRLANVWLRFYTILSNLVGQSYRLPACRSHLGLY